MPRARHVPGNDPLPGPTAGAVTLRRDVTECICDVNRVRITGVGANLVQVKHFTNRVKSLKLSCLFPSLTFYLSSRQILSSIYFFFFFFPSFLFLLTRIIAISAFTDHPRESNDWFPSVNKYFASVSGHNNRANSFSLWFLRFLALRRKPLIRLISSRPKGSAGLRVYWE